MFRKWWQTGMHEQQDHCPQRRLMLKTMAGGAALMAMPGLSQANIPRSQRALSFIHTHTGERLSLAYKAGSSYIPQSIAKISYLMRDFYNGQVHQIDTGLLDVLWQLQTNLKSHQPFEIISAYRSPATNNMLRKHSTGVAKDSMHLRGQAIDIRLPGVPLAHVRDAALDLKKGGVGYYPASDFVHVDTGRVRHW
ncbi:MAG TPA: YcbK family protein [Pseudomonadales bacterium]|nr:YcbK family protein [Pseudomonadales bacterium]